MPMLNGIGSAACTLGMEDMAPTPAAVARAARTKSRRDDKLCIVSILPDLLSCQCSPRAQAVLTIFCRTRPRLGFVDQAPDAILERVELRAALELETARAIEIDHDILLHPPGPCRKHDDAIRQKDG